MAAGLSWFCAAGRREKKESKTGGARGFVPRIQPTARGVATAFCFLDLVFFWKVIGHESQQQNVLVGPKGVDEGATLRLFRPAASETTTVRYRMVVFAFVFVVVLYAKCVPFGLPLFAILTFHPSRLTRVQTPSDHPSRIPNPHRTTVILLQTYTSRQNHPPTYYPPPTFLATQPLPKTHNHISSKLQLE